MVACPVAIAVRQATEPPTDGSAYACVCVCVCVWWWEWRVVRVSWGPGPVYDCARENRDNNRKCYVWGGVLRSLARSEIE